MTRARLGDLEQGLRIALLPKDAADEGGAWVREAALAHAEKRRARAQAAARIAAE